MGTGLLSGKYSVTPSKELQDEDQGISAQMFKTLVGKGHPEFSTKKQQDAQEFFSHILNLVERSSRNELNPGDSFKFKLEDRVQCSESKKVKYTHRAETVFSLNIPLEAAINKEEVAAYEARKSEAEASGKKLEPDSLVRAKIRLFSCLEAFSQSEIVEQYYSTALKRKTTARKYSLTF